MKKITTLSIGVLFSIASFADFAPNRLIVATQDNINIKVTVDGSRFDQQEYNNSIIFNNLTPGYHAVKVYQIDRRGGWFGRRNRNEEYNLLYTTSVCVKPLFETSIVLNRFGKAYIDEQPLRERKYDRDGGYNDKEDRRHDHDNRGRREDRDFDRDNNGGYGNNNYGNRNNERPLMNNSEFFTIKRMLERESFDDTRMVMAKHVADVNTLTAIQVREMAELFSFDNKRLDFAKYAYAKTIDKNNYIIVCNAFIFNSSKVELMDYLRSCRP